MENQEMPRWAQEIQLNTFKIQAQIEALKSEPVEPENKEVEPEPATDKEIDDIMAVLMPEENKKQPGNKQKTDPEIEEIVNQII